MKKERVYIMLDADMKRQIEESAKRNFRALNGEIQMALKLYLEGALNSTPIAPVQAFSESKVVNTTLDSNEPLQNDLSEYDDVDVDEI